MADQRSVRKPLRYGRVGAVILSWDFLCGLPVGIAVALLPAFSKAITRSAQGILLGITGIGAGLAGLVLTALTILLGSITPAYKRLLDKLPGGAAGPVLPFKIVIIVATVASLSGLIAALAWPLVQEHRWYAFAVFTVPAVTMTWALLGCVQVIGQLVDHMRRRDQAEELDQRRTALRTSA